MQTWGVGLEFVAKKLGSENAKAAEGTNYWCAHHQITVPHESFMIVVSAILRDDRGLFSRMDQMLLIRCESRSTADRAITRLSCARECGWMCTPGM